MTTGQSTRESKKTEFWASVLALGLFLAIFTVVGCIFLTCVIGVQTAVACLMH